MNPVIVRPPAALVIQRVTDPPLSASKIFLCASLFLWPHVGLYGFLLLAVQQCILSYQEPAKDWLAEGKKQLAEGHFTEAVVAFTQSKRLAPEDPRPYFLSGLALAEADNLSEAASEFEEAVRLAPDQPEYVLSQAKVLTRLGRKNPAVRALALFDKEGVANQLSEAGLWMLVDVCDQLTLHAAVLRTLDLLARRSPKDPRIDLERGRMYKAQGNLERAEESFRNSIEKSSRSPTAYFELSKILQQRNELDSAKKALLEAVKLEANNAVYLHELGSVCLALNEVDQAIEYLEHALPSAPSVPQIYYALGQAYQRKGDRAKAVEYLTKVQEINLARRKKEIRDQQETTLITLGEEQLDKGNRSEARALFQQLLTVNPDNWTAHEFLAKMSLDERDWQTAYPHLVAIERIDARSPEGNFLAAFYWYHQRDFQQARLYAEKAKAVRPLDAELRNLLGNIYLKLREPAMAFEEYQAAVRLAPNRTDFLVNLQSIQKRK